MIEPTTLASAQVKLGCAARATPNWSKPTAENDWVSLRFRLAEG